MKEGDKVRIVATWDTKGVFGKLRAESEYTLGSLQASDQPSPPIRRKTVEESGAPENLKSEDSVRLAVGRAQADMRSMATALEAYCIDYSEYPKTLSVLTTPVAYITRVMTDPFSTSGAAYQYENPKQDWILWSVGPDRTDDRAKIPFDPTNGTLSKGDIIRVKQ